MPENPELNPKTAKSYGIYTRDDSVGHSAFSLICIMEGSSPYYALNAYIDEVVTTGAEVRTGLYAVSKIEGIEAIFLFNVVVPKQQYNILEFNA